jgi:hypothetical protein
MSTKPSGGNLRALRNALAALLQWSRRADRERRTIADRERFWSEVREGQREAASRSRP